MVLALATQHVPNDLYDVITTAQTPYLFAGYSQAYINPRPKVKSIIVVLHFFQFHRTTSLDQNIAIKVHCLVKIEQYSIAKKLLTGGRYFLELGFVSCTCCSAGQLHLTSLLLGSQNKPFKCGCMLVPRCDIQWTFTNSL